MKLTTENIVFVKRFENADKDYKFFVKLKDDYREYTCWAEVPKTVEHFMATHKEEVFCKTDSVHTIYIYRA